MEPDESPAAEGRMTLAKRTKVPLIDRSVLAINPRPRLENKPIAQFRSPAHLAWLRTLNCACCGASGSTEAAHIRVGTDGAAGTKPSDFFTVPLLPYCHRRQHSISEREFWRQVNVGDPALFAVRKYAINSPCPKTREVAGKWLETGRIEP
jgi:hypothetical protein